MKNKTKPNTKEEIEKLKVLMDDFSDWMKKHEAIDFINIDNK